MVEINRPAAEGISGIRGRKELLEVDQIVELKVVVEERRFEAESLAYLHKGGLSS